MLKEFRAEKDQEPYQNWLAKNPNGLVANCSTSYQNSKRGYMLHRADCNPASSSGSWWSSSPQIHWDSSLASSDRALDPFRRETPLAYSLNLLVARAK